MLYYDSPSKALRLEVKLEGDDPMYIGEKQYYLNHLTGDAESAGKGKNSCVYLGVDIDLEEDVIVKFCSYHRDRKGSDAKLKIKRFEREIEAMTKARDHGMNKTILEIIDSGEINVDGRQFLYYAMEKADHDLDDFLALGDYSLAERFEACVGISRALRDLHDLGIYHRDLKGENLFVVDSKIKIGDLGFIDYRDADVSLDDPRERIGPTGRMSPEATNKAFARIDDCFYKGSTTIDESSDIFQLGLLFWQTLQGEIPTGHLVIDDFAHGHHQSIFNDIIMPSLQYAKSRRCSLSSLEPVFQSISRSLIPI